MRLAPRDNPAAEQVRLLLRRGFVLALQLRQMGQQFLFAGKPAEKETDHLVCPLGRLATRPQADQEAGNDRTIRLDLDAVLAMAQQVSAAQKVLEEPKKDFNGPPC